MLFLVMARRALRLKPWMAVASLTSNWCRIPFDGMALFGNKLKSAISKVTGGKSGMLPQDVRSRQCRYPERRQYLSRLTVFRPYRPGKDYRRNLKFPQATVARLARPKFILCSTAETLLRIPPSKYGQWAPGCTGFPSPGRSTSKTYSMGHECGLFGTPIEIFFFPVDTPFHIHATSTLPAENPTSIRKHSNTSAQGCHKTTAD